MKLSSGLPEGVDNGLSAIESKVIADPEKDYLIVGIVTGHKLTTDVETGDVVPTVKLVQVEALVDTDQHKQARELLARARGKRTGQTSINPETGEITE